MTPPVRVENWAHVHLHVEPGTTPPTPEEAAIYRETAAAAWRSRMDRPGSISIIIGNDHRAQAGYLGHVRKGERCIRIDREAMRASKPDSFVRMVSSAIFHEVIHITQHENETQFPPYPVEKDYATPEEWHQAYIEHPSERDAFTAQLKYLLALNPEREKIDIGDGISATAAEAQDTMPFVSEYLRSMVHREVAREKGEFHPPQELDSEEVYATLLADRDWDAVLASPTRLEALLSDPDVSRILFSSSGALTEDAARRLLEVPNVVARFAGRRSVADLLLGRYPHLADEVVRAHRGDLLAIPGVIEHVARRPAAARAVAETPSLTNLLTPADRDFVIAESAEALLTGEAALPVTLDDDSPLPLMARHGEQVVQRWASGAMAPEQQAELRRRPDQLSMVVGGQAAAATLARRYPDFALSLLTEGHFCALNVPGVMEAVLSQPGMIAQLNQNPVVESSLGAAAMKSVSAARERHEAMVSRARHR